MKEVYNEYNEVATILKEAGHDAASEVQAVAANIKEALGHGIYHIFGIEQQLHNNDEVEMREALEQCRGLSVRMNNNKKPGIAAIFDDLQYQLEYATDDQYWPKGVYLRNRRWLHQHTTPLQLHTLAPRIHLKFT